MQTKFVLSEEQSERLNILKLLMAVFVVCIHTNPPEFRLSAETIVLTAQRRFELLKYAVLNAQCAVPCFFLMASIFLYRKDFKWKDNIAKKCKSLLIPYCIMNTVWAIIYAVGQSIPQTAAFFYDPDYMAAKFSLYNWLQVYGIGAQFPLLAPLWTVRNIFILNLLAPAIKFFIDKFPRISLAAIIALYFLRSTTNSYYLEITELSMWCFGYFIVKYRIDINKFDDKKWIPAIYAATIMITLLCRDLNIVVVSTVLQRFRLVIGILFWYSCFTKNLDGTIQRLFRKYSKYNFGIYIFHYNVLHFAMKGIAKVLGTSIYVLVFEYLFLPLIVIIYAVTVCIVLKKVSPKAFSLVTGARVQ